jgi:hypothetical protein
LVFREKRRENMSVFLCPFGNRNMYDYSGCFNSTDMKRPFCDFDVKKEATVDEKTAFIKGRVL